MPTKRVECLSVTIADIHVASEYETVESNKYAAFWNNSCVSVEGRSVKPVRDTIVECARLVSARSFEEVQAAARAGSAEDLIDQGVR